MSEECETVKLWKKMEKTVKLFGVCVSERWRNKRKAGKFARKKVGIGFTCTTVFR